MQVGEIFSGWKKFSFEYNTQKTMNTLQETFAYLQMSRQDLQPTDIQKLASLVAYHSDLYYNQESPEISDTQFDTLFSLFSYAKEKFEQSDVLPVGSTLRSTFEKVAHSRAMISLDNTYNSEELREFDTRIMRLISRDMGKISYTVECKFDGIGIELIYRDGILAQALTRGDGIHGEDVTENIRGIENIPHKINMPWIFEIRGEVVMPISSFQQYNAHAQDNGQKIFASPRNAASGSVRLIDAAQTKKRNLQFYAYDLGNIDAFLKDVESKQYADMIAFLGKLGFSVSPFFQKCDGIEDVIEKIADFWDQKTKLDFEIDGLVVKVDHMSLWKEIGFTAHHPRYAIAYKFPAQEVVTKIESITTQVGKTWTITPVAILSPVVLWGVTISRATLHNFEEIAKLNISVGDYVFIKRAWEVIPKITGVSHHVANSRFSPPTHCPSCGTLLKKDDEKVRIYCPNTHDCPEQIFGRIVYSTGKQALNIDGLWPSQLRLFLKKWWIHDIADLFVLHEKREELLREDGYKERSVDTLLQNIQKARSQSIVRFLLALNIPGIGPTSARTLGNLFTKKEDFFSLPFGEETVLSQKDIGPETAKNICTYFFDPKNQVFLKRLLSYIEVKFSDVWAKSDGKFAGKSFCITGSFGLYWRDDIKNIFQEMWAIFVSSVSKQTDFLLVGKKPGSKLQKAQALGVSVIGQDEVEYIAKNSWYWQ